jgi:hypothetical protein
MMQQSSHSKSKKRIRLKSAIRKTPKEFKFIKLQLNKISGFDVKKVDSKEWVDLSLGKIEAFCHSVINSHENVNLVFMTMAISSVLAVHIRNNIQDKELVRKKERKEDRANFNKLSPRQQEIESYVKNLRSVRGSDPLLDSICELLHLCRWGTKNVPITSSKRSASPLSIHSKLQKQEILVMIAKLLKAMGLYKRKSLDTLMYSINSAYGNWNVHSIGGFPKTDKPHFSSRKGWIPNT